MYNHYLARQTAYVPVGREDPRPAGERGPAPGGSAPPAGGLAGLASGLLQGLSGLDRGDLLLLLIVLLLLLEGDQLETVIALAVFFLSGLGEDGLTPQGSPGGSDGGPCRREG